MSGAGRRLGGSQIERVAFWLRHRWQDPALVVGGATAAGGSLAEGGVSVAMILVGIALTGAGGVRALLQKPTYLELLIAKQAAERTSAAQAQQSGFLLRIMLAALASELELTATERVSLYLHDKAAFVMIARHSANPHFESAGRGIYPVDQGIIGDAWGDGVAYVSELPDPEAGDGKAYMNRNEKD